MSCTLLVATSREPQQLALALDGLRWMNRRGIDRVVIVVNNSGGTNARPEVLKLLKGVEDFHVYEYRGDRGPGNGLGLAIHDAAEHYPADRYLKIDCDTYPITRDWAQRLLHACDVHKVDQASAVVNVNTIGTRLFLEDLDLAWMLCDVDRIRYDDVDRQVQVWRATLHAWESVINWDTRTHLQSVETLSEVALVSANAMAFSRVWFERRTREQWAVIGEDERVLNTVIDGDQDRICIDRGALLLHWGYTPAWSRMADLWPVLSDALKLYWQ